ncbi:hypothetical protein J8N05_18715 [Streptomyces sp. BH-SS-21]|uniref:Uncharacterized protein n=1 Tax=Streptomyces liliiviolaceus TaxID=2823109 RepID=A0A940Y0T1_9ACTN|nr:hypothetical protein [Streptomyces liliiviolaceus]MBQ0850230.1 hypothetical protein [Streptomyces liliiviolaceus]
MPPRPAPAAVIEDTLCPAGPARAHTPASALSLAHAHCTVCGAPCTRPPDRDPADLPDRTVRIGIQQLESRLEAVVVPVVLDREGLPRHGGGGLPADRQDSELHGSSGGHPGLRPGTSDRQRSRP